MAENQVIVLAAGRILRDEGVVLEAHSSVTLIKCKNHRIVVDTGSREYRSRVVEALHRNDVSPEEVDILISTHLHLDHTANNDLFPNARKLVRAEEIPPRDYEAVFDDEEIMEGVTLVHTPGHTRGSMSVFVEADRRYGIAGDAIPIEDNYLKGVPPRLNYDPRTALRSMDRIVDYAEVIVPGHGPPFEVDR